MLNELLAWIIALSAVPFLVFAVGRRPAVFLAALVPSQILLGGMERGGLVPGLRPGELILGICLGSLVLSPQWRLSQVITRPLNSWVLVYCLTGFLVPVLTWALRGHEVTPTVLQAYASVAKGLLVYFAIAPLEIADDELRTTLRWTFWSAVASAVVAILQRVDMHFVSSLLLAYYKTQHLYERLVGHTARPSGLAGNWHALGMEFVMGLVLGRLALTSLSRRGRVLITAGMFLLLLGVVAVATITSILVVVFLIGIAGWRALALVPTPRRRWLRGLAASSFVTVAVSLVLYLAAGRGAYSTTLIPASMYVRLYNWLFVYGPVITGHLLFGYGPFLPEVAARSDDSQFVLFLLRGGLVALLGWLVAVAGILRWTRRESRRDECELQLIRVAFAFSAVLATASLVQSFFTYTGVVEWYWATIGLVSARWTLPARGDASLVPVKA